MRWFLQDDPHLVLLSFAYIVAVIVLAELLRRLVNPSPDVSRKTVHILVAAWALPTALLFENRFWAAATPLTFVILNAVSYRFRLMELIEEEGQGSPGTIYFPLSFAGLILVFWPLEGGRAASVAGLYAMGFGDAAASILGRRWGRHPYRAFRTVKSLEGSLAMLVFSFAAMLLGTVPLAHTWLWIPAGVAALAAAAAEAPAGRGTDNLTVPWVAAGMFLLLLRAVS